jgi:UDP-GlcNAc3NAcA epimerase
MKIVTVVGARPQFIKAAAVSRALAHAGLEEIIVHTGQHFDANMSDIFFSEMEIPRPHHNLAIGGLPHGAMTGRMMEGIESVLQREKPDYTLVYGDTNSTLAGALAAAKLKIPVAHVEAGLRSFDRTMPEEINRILTDRISDLLFCPTQAAIDNLKREGFEFFPCRIVRTGDVMFDAALYYLERARKQESIIATQNIQTPFALATLHRAENTDNPARLKAIAEALNELSDTLPVVLPLHPRTRMLLQQNGIDLRVNVLEPASYLAMLQLLDAASLVLTDSGGLQKEAYFFRKPCITLRDQTEWTELLHCGANVLAGARKENILALARQMLTAQPDFSAPLYGDGRAAEQIVAALTVGFS